MGVLTQADFYTEILAGLGNRQDVTNQRLTLALNLAQSRISRAYDFSEMATVAFAQMSFTSNPAIDKYMIPPPLTKTIHSFVCLDTSAGLSSMGQSRKVVEKSWRWFDQRFPAPEWLPPNWPVLYKRWGNVIVMAPAPYLQFTAQLSFTTFPAPFVTGAGQQTSEFTNKDDLLISYCLGYFSKLYGRIDKATYFEGLAKEQLDEAIDKDDTRPDLETSRDVPALAGIAEGPYWANPWVRTSVG